MPLKDNTRVALDALISWMKDEKPDDRAEVFRILDREYCENCGDLQDKSGHGCNCMRDD